MSGDYRKLSDKDIGDIGDAADWIGARLRKFGRIDVRQTKEKFGTARVYCTLGWSGLHCITHPGYAYSQYPKWLWHLEVYYFPAIISPLNYIVLPFHRWLYRRTYIQAMRRWPNVRVNIFFGADFQELLENILIGQ